MVRLKEEVVDVQTGLLGQVVDVNYNLPRPYGISFSGDEQKGIRWCAKEEIKKKANVVALIFGEGIHGRIGRKEYSYDVDVASLHEGKSLYEVLIHLNLMDTLENMQAGDLIVFEDESII